MGALSRTAIAVFFVTVAMVACARTDFSASPKSAPDLPQWSSQYAGKPLASIGPRTFRCIGYVDAVTARYSGKVPGVMLVGWGWDSAAKKPVQRVLVTDADAVVSGAGNGGTIERDDVPQRLKAITSKMTGWQAIANVTTGAVDVWEVNPNAVCHLGTIEL